MILSAQLGGFVFLSYGLLLPLFPLVLSSLTPHWEGGRWANLLFCLARRSWLLLLLLLLLEDEEEEGEP